jgi:nitrogen fixation protein FixH
MPTSPSPNERQDTPRDKRIPYYFVAAFLLLIVVDVVLVTIAVSTQTGVVVKNHYERGLAYNQYLADDEAQKARGWQGKLALADQGRAVSLTLLDKSGQPLSGAVVEVNLMRTVQDGMDFKVALAETAPGVYMKEVTFPQPGLWTAQASATWQNQPYRIETQIVVPKL